MGKLIAIDLGLKRTGIAETDSAKIIAYPKETVDSKNLSVYLKQLVVKEKIDGFIIGMPYHLDGNENNMTNNARELGKWIENNIKIPVHFIDERFSSKMALDSMIQMGSTKKDRQNKGNIDKISAAIILQDFLKSNS